MHDIALIALLSVAPLGQIGVPNYGSAPARSATIPYRGSTTDPYGAATAPPMGDFTGEGIRGTVRTNARTRSVRTPTGTNGSTGGYQPLDSSIRDFQFGVARDPRDSDYSGRGSTYPPGGGYRTADARGREPLTDSRREDSRREALRRDDQDYVDRDRYLDTRGAGSSRLAERDPYDDHYPPLGSRDLLDNNPDSIKASQLLKMWIEPSRSDDPRRVLSLYQAISGVNGTKDQIDVVKIYWGWVLAMAELRGMADEDAVLNEIGRAVPPRSAYEQSLLRSAIEACRSRTAEAKRDVVARLVDLQEVSGQRSAEAQLPGDFPFVGEYDTRYGRTFANRTPPANLRKIHNTLPEDLKVIRARAVATDEAVNLMADSGAAYVAKQISLNEVLESVADARAQRRAFLEAVHHYNGAIAEYSLNIAGNGATRESVVSMLIGSQAAGASRQRLAYGNGTTGYSYDRSGRGAANYGRDSGYDRDYGYDPSVTVDPRRPPTSRLPSSYDERDDRLPPSPYLR